MTFSNAFSAFRRYAGWADISDSRLSPAHGWLLPLPSTLNTLRASPGPEPRKNGDAPAVHGGPRWLGV